jgi:pyruvate formate lyase activating enzyme
VITDVNDDDVSLRNLVERHIKELGVETPLHFTRYHPTHNFRKPPTKIATLENAYRIARSEGVLFPYVGNVAGHPYENTYCPQCEKLLIRRDGHRLKEYKITSEQQCPSCHFKVAIEGKHVQKRLASPLWV